MEAARSAKAYRPARGHGPREGPGARTAGPSTDPGRTKNEPPPGPPGRTTAGPTGPHHPVHSGPQASRDATRIQAPPPRTPALNHRIASACATNRKRPATAPALPAPTAARVRIPPVRARQPVHVRERTSASARTRRATSHQPSSPVPHAIPTSHAVRPALARCGPRAALAAGPGPGPPLPRRVRRNGTRANLRGRQVIGPAGDLREPSRVRSRVSAPSGGRRRLPMCDPERRAPASHVRKPGAGSGAGLGKRCRRPRCAGWPRAG